MSLDADPVRAIRADPELWAVADDYPPFGPRFGDEPLPDISRALLDLLPAGADWVQHYPDRSFQQAEYLLDPVAFRAGERTIAHRIVCGDEVFAAHAKSGQGFTWRCSTSAFLATAVQRIDALDVAAVRREFSVEEMADLGLYKVHPEDDDAFPRVLSGLRAVAEHYRDVVARGFDLIITKY